MDNSYLSDFIYGGMDGTITTLAIISGVAGAGLPPIVIFIIGLASLFADGFSMAAGRYIGLKTEITEESKKPIPPIKSSIATFLAFLGMGTLALIVFIYAHISKTKDSQILYIITYAIVFINLVVIGYVRGLTLKNRGYDVNPHLLALETLLVGGLASTIAYMTGRALKNY